MYYYNLPYMNYYRFLSAIMYNPYMIQHQNNTHMAYIPYFYPSVNPYAHNSYMNTYFDSLSDLNNIDATMYPDYSNIDAGRGKRWPKECFATYVSMPYDFIKGTSDTDLPYYNLCYVVSENSSSFKPTWNGNLAINNTTIASHIKKIRDMGGDVMVSFGGYSNTPLQATAPDVKSLKKQYEMFIKAYKITHINIDIDGKWINDTDSLIKNFRALKQLQSTLFLERYSLQIWITLPAFPSGLTSAGLKVIQHALDQDLVIRGYNLKTMNFGSKEAPSYVDKMGQYSIQAASMFKEQLKKLYEKKGLSRTDSQYFGMIGITPMIGVNDVVSEKFTLSDAKIVFDYAKQNSIGMISMWSYNRDHPCPNGPSNTVYSTCSSIEQDDYEFSELFNGYNDLSYFETTKPHKRKKLKGTRRWNPHRKYITGDKVTYRGLLYQATQDNKGTPPKQDASNPAWNILG